ncbi:hypothetical protein GCM10008107_31490 [Psychrosphaera saromensis]|uniref:Uncharacterized protein n=1 Tax=Psychrosphaera saromensis TaxID=716813 RepID=A0A2S7UXX8_9GAMM|nr:hypothetical protein BTO11_10965 [Psychrosphaera saromensis]GHB79772.1 hypothetical protein GCM10008107_31490 [Psychrosphaera saromensis]GLQ12761.1 hypothetical protein GCM10007917_02160 [Psychrosphaera saromensis]
MQFFFIIAFSVLFIGFQLNAFIQRKRGLLVSIVFTSVVIVLLCIYAFFTESSSYARESQTIKLIVVNFIIFLIPSVVIVWLAWISRAVKPMTLHIISIVVAILLTAAFPLIALFTSCYTGLDCI